MAVIPSGGWRVLAVEEASPPVLGSGEGRQVEAEDATAHEWVPQTQVSDKLEATSLLTPARTIQSRKSMTQSEDITTKVSQNTSFGKKCLDYKWIHFDAWARSKKDMTVLLYYT